MILAAGKGERLLPLTRDFPKPALPLGGKPLILRTLYWLKQQGVKEAIVNLYYKKEVLLDILAESSFSIGMSLEEELLGTGGGIRRAASLWNGEWLLVLNGDTLVDLSLPQLLPSLKDRRVGALLVLRPDHEVMRWGAIFAPSSTLGLTPILSFFSSSHPEARPYMFTGIHFIRRSLVERLPGKGCVIRDGYARWVGEGFIWGYIHEGPWLEIGTPEAYQKAQDLFCKGKIPWLLLPGEKVS